MKSQIESLWIEEVRFLQELIRMPSDNPPGDCAEHAECTANLLEKMGFSVNRLPVPEPYVKQQGMKSVTNLIIKHSFGTGSGKTVALNSHGDAVPPGEGWSEDPYGGEIKSGNIYGCGSVMSKSDFATYVFALRALHEFQEELDGIVEIHLTYDEEKGGLLGPKWLLEHGHSNPDFAITAGMTHMVSVSHAGCLHLEIIIRGRQAHAAIPESGVDALQATTPVLEALYREKEKLESEEANSSDDSLPRLTIGMISGGISANVVPNRVKVTLDRRLSLTENGETVEQNLIALIEKSFPKSSELELECRRVLLAEPLRPVRGVEELAELISDNAEKVLGTRIAQSSIPLFTDARHYSEVGIPTVMFGAGPNTLAQSNAHGVNEKLYLDDLRAATEIVVLTLKNLLSNSALD